MHPHLLPSVDAYPFFLILGDLVGIGVALYCAERAGLPRRRFALVLLLLTVAAVLGAKFYGLIERGGKVGPFAYEVFAGYRYPGGLIGFAISVWLVSRRSLLNLSPGMLADVVTPSFGFALAVVRAGCLLAGCCYGRVCDVPWAIRFPGGSQPWRAQVQAGLLSRSSPASLPVHPLQVYFALLALGLGVLTLRLQSRKQYNGQVFLIFVAGYGAAQFLLEFLRFGPLPHVQYMALASSISATLMLMFNVQWRRPITLESARAKR